MAAKGTSDVASDVTQDVASDETSDEVYTSSCSPCGHKGIQKKATQYCLDCQELLCLTCKELHQTFKQSRHHCFTAVGSDRKVFLDSKIMKSNKIKVRITSDKSSPQITGAAFLPDGRIILCDRNNNNMKLLDAKLKVQDSYEFPSHPRDVAVVDNKSVVIILPDHKSLQYVDIETKLKPGRVILLNKMPLAVEIVNNDIFIACKTKGKDGTGEIQILDRDGNRKRRLGIKPNGSCMFDCPSHFAVSKPTQRIYVSDRDTSTVTCIAMANDTVIYQYKDPDLIRARGVYVDAVDNILVVGESSTNVQLVTFDGKKHSTLLTSSDIVRQPCSIAYREKDDTLIVGCYNQNLLLMFKIQ